MKPRSRTFATWVLGAALWGLPLPSAKAEEWIRQRVEAGDTLSGILSRLIGPPDKSSLRIYGRGGLLTKTQRLNERLGNPDLLLPGQELRLPLTPEQLPSALPAPAPSPSPVPLPVAELPPPPQPPTQPPPPRAPVNSPRYYLSLGAEVSMGAEQSSHFLTKINSFSQGQVGGGVHWHVRDGEALRVDAGVGAARLFYPVGFSSAWLGAGHVEVSGRGWLLGMGLKQKVYSSPDESVFAATHSYALLSRKVTFWLPSAGVSWVLGSSEQWRLQALAYYATAVAESSAALAPVSTAHGPGAAARVYYHGLLGVQALGLGGEARYLSARDSVGTGYDEFAVETELRWIF